jgi:ketosteroid isomerase-like protein
MSKKNVQLLRRCTELLNVGDWDALLELYDPDVQVELRDLQRPPDVPDVLHGREAVRRVVAHWTAPYDEFGAEIHDYIDAEPWVICDTRSHAQDGSESTREDVHFADAYEVRDGRIVRAILGYADVAQAVADVAGQSSSTE